MTTQYQPTCCGISLRTASLAFAGLQGILALVVVSFNLNSTLSRMLLFEFTATAALGVYGIKKKNRKLISSVAKAYWVEFVVLLFVCAVTITSLSFRLCIEINSIDVKRDNYSYLKRLYNELRPQNQYVSRYDSLGSYGDGVPSNKIYKSDFNESYGKGNGNLETKQPQISYVDADTYFRDNKDYYDHQYLQDREQQETLDFITDMVIFGALTIIFGLLKLGLCSNFHNYYLMVKQTPEAINFDHNDLDGKKSNEVSVLLPQA